MDTKSILQYTKVSIIKKKSAKKVQHLKKYFKILTVLTFSRYTVTSCFSSYKRHINMQLKLKKGNIFAWNVNKEIISGVLLCNFISNDFFLGFIF